MSSYRVCELTGATYRQLDYWCRCAWIDDPRWARGSGTRRRFNPASLDTIAALVKLHRLGCCNSTTGDNSEALRRALDAVRARPVEHPEYLLVSMDPPLAWRAREPGDLPRLALWVVPLAPIEMEAA